MTGKFISSVVALPVLIGSLMLSEAQAQATANQGVQFAQNAQSDEYLPPWQRGRGQAPADEPGAPQSITPPQTISPPQDSQATLPPPSSTDTYNSSNSGYNPSTASTRYDAPPPRGYNEPPSQAYAPAPYQEDTYSSNEIVAAGEHFFGGITKGLAKVVEHAFSKQGRPNGYILGEEGGGAFVAGLRYGEGTLYTKNAGIHRLYWQGPSFGYDFGAEGSKTMILVYNLHEVNQIYNRFAGIDGSAYLVGGVGVTFQTYDDIVLAPIRSGVGLRLGANVGYLKYTRTPTWNPF